MSARSEAALLPLRPLQLDHALASVMDIAVVPTHDRTGVIIRFKAIPASFAPSAFDGVTLKLNSPAFGPITGTLVVISEEAPRGLWISYRFESAAADLMDRLGFEGINNRSRVESLEIEHRRMRHTFKNPFRRP